jgi:dTDP-4-dehydrorhamnose 3,5-epimerase
MRVMARRPQPPERTQSGSKESPRDFRSEDGALPGCRKDFQVIRPDWVRTQRLIDGVHVREQKNVFKRTGILTEVFRRDWGVDEQPVDQVFQVLLAGSEISAWHTHQFTLDRLFVSQGRIRIVLYDGRRGSRTFGRINELQFGDMRPGLVVIPPGVWHGIQNVSAQASLILNLVDRAYSYTDPDHWRLPVDTAEIPYRFPGLPGDGGQ